MLTVEVRADGKAPRLARGDGLRHREERRAQGPDALVEQDGARVEGGPGGGDLDADAVPGHAQPLELAGVGAGVGDDLVGVVGVEGGALEQDPALEVGEVLGAEECALAPRRSPELIWLILMILDESLGNPE